MKTLSILNKVFNFADDVTLIVPQFTDSSMEAEYENAVEWPNSMELTLNTKKTKEIIFYRSRQARSKYNIERLNGIERIEQTTLLGFSQSGEHPRNWRKMRIEEGKARHMNALGKLKQFKKIDQFHVRK